MLYWTNTNDKGDDDTTSSLIHGVLYVANQFDNNINPEEVKDGWLLLLLLKQEGIGTVVDVWLADQMEVCGNARESASEKSCCSKYNNILKW